MAAVRIAILRHLRLRAVSPAAQVPSPFASLLRCGFSDEVKGSFLDKSEVADRIITVVKNFQKVDPSKLLNKETSTVHIRESSGLEKVTSNAHFQKDLGLDSLDTVEVVMALEEEFGFEIPDSEADKIDCIKVAVDFIASHPHAK